MTRARSARRSARRAAGIVAVVVTCLIAFAAIVAPVAVLALRPASAPVPPSPDPSATAIASPPVVPTAPVPTPVAPPPSPVAEGCDGGATTLTVWAHPDDDIIFANPTISDALAAGDCVRTVFVTAGDAGKGMDYVNSRELGILRAYNAMRGSGGLWDPQEVVLDSGLRVHRLVPQDSDRVSILFLRLPDGNITGEGFAATEYATLGRLVDGDRDAIVPVDGGPPVSADQVRASLAEFARAFAPAQTLTHIPAGSAFAPGDHPDHSVVGALVRSSIGGVAEAAPGLRYLVGYPSADLPKNVDGAALDAKVETYRIYTQQDEVIRCADRAACLGTPRFGEWLQRSYPKTEAELQLG